MDEISAPPRAWSRAAGVMFGVGWGANQFSSLLLAYELHDHVGASTADALFGVYALGLIPALLIIGPVSDIRGRRGVVLAAGALSFVASVSLIAGQHALGLLYLGRFLAGVSSGAAFAAGTAWVKELSVAPFDPAAGSQAGAQRAAVALSAGFGLGPLVAGMLAQFAPDPLLVAYLPHLVVISGALVVARSVPETARRSSGGVELRRLLRVPSAGHARFARMVAPSAPWVFAAPSVAFAVLPGLVARETGSFQVGFASLMAALTLGVGVLVQPFARRLDRARTVWGLVAGLAAVIVGVLLGALAAQLDSWVLVIGADILLGAGYGLCLVSGLLETQALAAPDDLASLTAVFYALTYVGFAVPLVLAELEHLAAAPVLLLAGAGLAGIVLVAVLRTAGRHPVDGGAGGAG